MAVTGSVFVIEDEHVVREDIRDCLEQIGYEVAGVAAAAAEALRLIDERRPDLALVDIRIRGPIDGVDLAAQLRQRYSLPVVFLTAHADDRTLQRAAETAPFGYLLKPFGADDLKAAIEIALAKAGAERKLRDDRDWLEMTLGSLADALIAVDQRDCIVFLNSVAESLTGWTLREVAGHPVREILNLIECDSDTPVADPLLQALSSGVARPIERVCRLVARDGTKRMIDDSTSPILGRQGQVLGAVMVFRDISERARFAEHLRRLHKMDAIGRMAGGVAHDFNNLLTVINGHVGEILARPHIDDSARDGLERVRTAGERGAALTRQLLIFSRREVRAPQVVDLAHFVADMRPLLAPIAGEQVAFTLVGTDLALPVCIEPQHLEQVIFTLFTNARDAMPGGGAIRVELARAEPDDVLRAGLARGEYVLLSVSDEGEGMRDDVREHLFEPFFTTKDHGQGAGLGLALLYGIVKQSGGEIEVESHLGVGSIFRVFLPLAAEPSAAETTSLEGGVANAPAMPTVLLVEDEEMVRSLIKAWLERDGWAVLDAGAAEQALDMFDAAPESFDAVVTDIVLPGMDGHALLARLRERRADLPALLMSGYPGGTADALHTLPPNTAYLSKPFHPAELKRRLREIARLETA